jgi:hypothetical protein
MPHSRAKTLSRCHSSLATLATLLAVLTLLAAGELRADWLITKDGQRIKTDGAPRIEGRRVLYHNETGNLSAIRLSEVDLEATDRANSAGEATHTVEVNTPDAPSPGNDIENYIRSHRQLDGEEQPTTLVEPMEPAPPEAEALDEAMEEMGEAMAEAMAEAMGAAAESMGEMMGGVLELGLQLEQEFGDLESRYDLHTAQGMAGAAPELERMAELVKRRAEAATPELREMYAGLATTMREMAQLARTDPAAAARRYREQQSSL